MGIIKTTIKAVAVPAISLAASTVFVPWWLTKTIEPAIKVDDMSTGERVVRTVAYTTGNIVFGVVVSTTVNKVIDIIIPD